jgi:hypothetical protein
VLLALDRSTVKELTGVVKLALGVLRGKSVTSSFLGTVEPPGDTRDDDQRALEVLLGQRPGRKPPSRGDDLLRQAEEDYRNDRLPEALTDAGATETLGLPSYFYQTEVEKVAPEEALRQALQEWMAGDDTFGLTTQDETFRELDKRVGSGIDFLIAGHTHLPRAIRRKPGFYYNSGTWIRLIYLTEKLTATSEAFEPVYRALTAGSMDALDRTPGLILPLYTVVRVRDEGKMGVKGELLKVVGEPEDLRLETMPGSEFVKLAGI